MKETSPFPSPPLMPPSPLSVLFPPLLHFSFFLSPPSIFRGFSFLLSSFSPCLPFPNPDPDSGETEAWSGLPPALTW